MASQLSPTTPTHTNAMVEYYFTYAHPPHAHASLASQTLVKKLGLVHETMLMHGHFRHVVFMLSRPFGYLELQRRVHSDVLNAELQGPLNSLWLLSIDEYIYA